MSFPHLTRPTLVSVDLADGPTAGALSIRPAQPFWTSDQLAALVQLGIEKAPRPDLSMFLNQCQRTGLDPFARQIYMIPRNDQGRLRWTIQTGIDGFRLIADRTGTYEGQTPQQWCGPDGRWRDVWTERKPPLAARIGVYRKGFREPVYAVANWMEYAVYKGPVNERVLTAFWRRMPVHMISKVAEALALRKTFPQDLSGLYTTDEMDQANYSTVERIAESVPEQRTTAGQPRRPAERAADPSPYDWDALIAKAEQAPADDAAAQLRDLYALAVYANRIGQCPDETVTRITAAGETAVHDLAREREQRQAQEAGQEIRQVSLFDMQ